MAAEIRSAGGAAEVAVVDALDEKAVDEHANASAASAGGIDISMNVITHPQTHGVPTAEMDVDDFMARSIPAARTTFITSMAAARLVARSASRLRRFGRPRRLLGCRAQDDAESRPPAKRDESGGTKAVGANPPEGWKRRLL